MLAAGVYSALFAVKKFDTPFYVAKSITHDLLSILPLAVEAKTPPKRNVRFEQPRR